MHELIQIGILFGAKMLDNMLSTAKTILIQRNRCILAGISLALSNYIYFLITKNIVTADNDYAIIVVSVASGIGCLLAMAISNRFSKERTFVNVIMSDDKCDMQKLRDFLASITSPTWRQIRIHSTGTSSRSPSRHMRKQRLTAG